MTKEVLARMPQNVLNSIEQFRKDYKNPAISRAETRARAAGYVHGLRDGGLITETERKVLFVYFTV